MRPWLKWQSVSALLSVRPTARSGRCLTVAASRPGGSHHRLGSLAPFTLVPGPLWATTPQFSPTMA